MLLSIMLVNGFWYCHIHIHHTDIRMYVLHMYIYFIVIYMFHAIAILKRTGQVLTKAHNQAQRRPFKFVDLFGPNHQGAVSWAREQDTMTSSQPRWRYASLRALFPAKAGKAHPCLCLHRWMVKWFRPPRGFLQANQDYVSLVAPYGCLPGMEILSVTTKT